MQWQWKWQKNIAIESSSNKRRKHQQTPIHVTKNSEHTNYIFLRGLLARENNEGDHPTLRKKYFRKVIARQPTHAEGLIASSKWENCDRQLTSPVACREFTRSIKVEEGLSTEVGKYTKLARNNLRGRRTPPDVADKKAMEYLRRADFFHRWASRGWGAASDYWWFQSEYKRSKKYSDHALKTNPVENPPFNNWSVN